MSNNVEHFEMKVDFKTRLLDHIISVATRNASCKPPDTPTAQFKMTAEDVREASDLVFLAMDLVTEWEKR